MTNNNSTSSITLPTEIRAEQLSRNELYFGKEGMENIQNASILVVGLGGVGSHTAHMLARAGVGYLKLVDFDQVTLSSLNRHACATLSDVGLPKVTVLKRFLEKICPDRSFLEIDDIVQMYTGDPEKDGSAMDCPPHRPNGYDIIIDAIDDVPTKAKLLAYAVKNNVRIVSCMGAGGKSDMTRLHISDLRTATRDPLATKLRQVLRKMIKDDPELAAADIGDSCVETADKIAVVYSSEKPVVKLAEMTQEQREEGINNFGAMDNMRVRVMPVLGTMPAIMGQSLAAFALCELAGKPFSPLSGERVGRSVRQRMFQHLRNREIKIRKDIESQSIEENTEQKSYKVDDADDDGNIIFINGINHWVGPLQIDTDDVEYVYSEVWRHRCCITGKTLGTPLELCRWNPQLPSNCSNIVLLGARAMREYDEEAKKTGDGRNSISPELREKIEARLATARIDSRA